MPSVLVFDDPRMDRTPVIVVTSYDQPETRRKALNLGAIDVMIKPASNGMLEPIRSQYHII